MDPNLECSIVQVCVAGVAIFLSVFYVLFHSLATSAEEVKAKIEERDKLTDDEKCTYSKITHFISISAEYFHLMAVFLIFNILKLFPTFLKIDIFVVCLNFLYLLYFAAYFAYTSKRKDIHNHVLPAIVSLFCLLPIITWLLVFWYDFRLDILVSSAVLVVILLLWFAYYPVRYAPFANLSKLKERRKNIILPEIWTSE